MVCITPWLLITWAADTQTHTHIPTFKSKQFQEKCGLRMPGLDILALEFKASMFPT